MQKLSLNELIEFNDKKFNPKVLFNEPGYRMVLMSMKAGQSIPEHGNPGVVTVLALRGYVTFYENDTPCELHAGDVVKVNPGALHHLEAHEDSALFVMATAGAALPADKSEELDLREVPRPLRHPMIFAKFDALAVGDSVRLLNDHDPIPLNRQFESIRPGQASWEYIERGPALFRIRIRRIGTSSASDVPVTAPPQTVQIESNRR
jgi:uncharacterized protein (DUF2249 family)